MKSIVTIIMVLCFCQHIYCQSSNLEQVFKTSTVYFYGYDFTHFKIVEPKRIGQDTQMKGFIFELIQLMNEKRVEKFYESTLKKDTVIFDQKPVNALNMSIDPANIIGTFEKHSIPKDSLQTMVDRYNTEGKTGIGYVLIIECFYKIEKETSIWHVFFDIDSKKILDSYETFNTDADSYHGLAAYWSVGISYGQGKYSSDYYRPLLRKSKKN